MSQPEDPQEKQGAPDALENQEGSAEAEPEADRAKTDAVEALREPLNRWFAAVGQDASAALSKKAEVIICNVEACDGGKLAALFEKPLTVAHASAGTRDQRMPLALAACEEAVLVVAAGMLGQDKIESLTDEAKSAFENLARQVWGSLEHSWTTEGAKGLLVEPGAIEQAGAPGEALSGTHLVHASLAVQIEGRGEAEVSFLLPIDLHRLLTGAEGEKATDGEGEPLSESVSRILKVKVPLVVQIARRRTTVREVLSFRPGAVVEFDKRSDEMLDLYAGTCPIGRGEAVKVGESFGIRVLEIGTARETAAKLGGETPK